MNVVTTVDCIDHERTIGEMWSEGDGRPEKMGEYRMIGKLALDPSRSEGAQVFFPAGWPVVIAVTERVRQALDRHRVTGVIFEPVG